MSRKDLTGQRFGRLVVVEPAEKQNGRTAWVCHCDCGETTVVLTKRLTTGHTKACGCLKRTVRLKHGLARSKTYQAWHDMKYRCLSETNKRWKDYGGRGITIDPSWMDFENFLRDMGEAPPGMSLERVDNDGNYCKENCIWASWEDQYRNRRTSILITLEGETKTISEWCRHYGINRSVYVSRTKRGWSIEAALTTPADTRYRNKRRAMGS